jgi:ribonuclease P protein component
MVVSKRLLSRAVDRNLVRRKIREVFRQMARDLPALDLVVRPLALPTLEQSEYPQALKKTLSQKNAAWVEELQGALAKASEKCRS